MLEDLRRIVTRISDRYKRRFWGPTFRCPVCHLVLAAIDADGNGLLVCPVCGAVLEIEQVYGHIVPVVLDMEIFRPQPKARLHPLSTHLPIGLFPFALLSAAVLFLLSLLPATGRGGALAGVVGAAPTLAAVTLVLLVISVGFSALTFASGYRDWRLRYRARPYRQISLKIALSAVFLAAGAVAVVLHASGQVFSATSGLMQLGSPLGLAAAVAYLGLLGANMIVLGTLGHIGGTLVFGR